MKNTFEILNATRTNVSNAIKDLTTEQLNKVPKGFNNNIIWNVAHIVVTQQLLCYGLSDNKMLLSQKELDDNRKGSTPNVVLSEDEIEFWKQKLSSTAKQMEDDYNNSLFQKYSEYPTSYNVVLKNIEDAINFNNIHEALHFGYIMALKKAL